MDYIYVRAYMRAYARDRCTLTHTYTHSTHNILCETIDRVLRTRTETHTNSHAGCAYKYYSFMHARSCVVRAHMKHTHGSHMCVCVRRAHKTSTCVQQHTLWPHRVVYSGLYYHACGTYVYTPYTHTHIYATIASKLGACARMN